MKDKILIMGNKPYKKFKFNEIIDSFEEICRCNLSLPNRNNGTKYGKLALCSHFYENLIRHPVSLERFIDIYKEEYIEEEIAEFFNKFNPSDFEDVFYAAPDASRCNRWLAKHNCPYSFSRRLMPRTGYTVLFGALSSPTQAIYVSHFSIREERAESYATIGKPSDCHDPSEEANILRWLHSNSYVDASLCLLEDETLPTLAPDDLELSPVIKTLLNK
jgi:hypothetical protein